jgi:hypothetical protein
MGHRPPHLARPACPNTARACGLFSFPGFAPHAATAAVCQPSPLGSPPRRDSRPVRLPLPLSASKPATARQRAAVSQPAAAARRCAPLASPPRPPDARPLPFPYPASAEARHAPPWGADAATPPAAASPPARADAASRGGSPPPGCATPAPPARTPPARPPKPPPDAPPPFYPFPAPLGRFDWFAHAMPCPDRLKRHCGPAKGVGSQAARQMRPTRGRAHAHAPAHAPAPAHAHAPTRPHTRPHTRIRAHAPAPARTRAYARIARAHPRKWQRYPPSGKKISGVFGTFFSRSISAFLRRLLARNLRKVPAR